MTLLAERAGVDVPGSWWPGSGGPPGRRPGHPTAVGHPAVRPDPRRPPPRSTTRPRRARPDAERHHTGRREAGPGALRSHGEPRRLGPGRQRLPPRPPETAPACPDRPHHPDADQPRCRPSRSADRRVGEHLGRKGRRSSATAPSTVLRALLTLRRAGIAHGAVERRLRSWWTSTPQRCRLDRLPRRHLVGAGRTARRRHRPGPWRRGRAGRRAPSGRRSRRPASCRPTWSPAASDPLRRGRAGTRGRPRATQPQGPLDDLRDRPPPPSVSTSPS